jgi:exosortase
MNPYRHGWPAILCLGCFGILYAPVLLRLGQDWARDDNYSHGFLILPLAAYFAYERRHQLANAAPKPSWTGFFLVVFSLALLIIGRLGAELFLTRISVVGVIAGMVLFVFGTVHARILMFPIGFLLLMIPLPTIVFNEIAFPLQLVASRFGELALNLFRIPVFREGNVIVLANTTLEVAEACSGIRSLITLLTLAIVLGYFTDSRLWVRVAIAIATIPVAIVANGLRVAGTGVAAHFIGPDAAGGFLHTFSGWMMFVLALALLLALQRLLVAVLPPVAEIEMAVAS